MRFFSVNSTRYVVFSLAFLLSLLALASTGISFVRAASLDDPWVVIAVDATAHVNCRYKVDVNIGTPQEHVVQNACSAGTIMSTQTVRLSQALAQHEQYVQFSASSAPVVSKQQVTQQIETLAETEGASIRKAAGVVALYTTSCGDSTSADLSWSPGGTSLYSDVTYQREADPNCGNVQIDSASVGGTGQQSTTLWWDHDQYASWSSGTSCPQIPVSSTLTQSRNVEQTAGYYYENWVKDNPCQAGSGTFWHNDMLLN